MKRLALAQTSRLWFRRWSRSRVAVFHSMGCCVLIGHLSTQILSSLGLRTEGVREAYLNSLSRVASTIATMAGGCVTNLSPVELALLLPFVVDTMVQQSLCGYTEPSGILNISVYSVSVPRCGGLRRSFVCSHTEVDV